MLDNVNDHFNDFWLNNNLEDCGKISQNYTTCYLVNEDDSKKLNNIHKNNTSYILNNNESTQNTGNNIIKRTNYIFNKRNEFTSIKSNDYIKTRSDRLHYKETSNANNSISKNIDSHKNKRVMCSLQKNSRLYEYNDQQRKIMLDSCTKPRMNSYSKNVI